MHRRLQRWTGAIVHVGSARHEHTGKFSTANSMRRIPPNNNHFIFPFAQEIRANFTSPLARFAVSNLHPGSLYIASIYAFNAKGRSDPAVLPAAMLRLPEKQLTSEKGERTLDILLIENGAEHQSHFSSQRNCALRVSKVGVCRERISDFDKSIAEQHQLRWAIEVPKSTGKSTPKNLKFSY